ncbi:unnamed protein product [Prorocentrum cordatum]|uniref:Uncharacterized protein n=1 Tax=Prorocentrum cordatum TaxID=2364126 RepID=A0ABN9XCC9_9DINO|nr:unnamed protein product [Polarella glacialis]
MLAICASDDVEWNLRLPADLVLFRTGARSAARLSLTVADQPRCRVAAQRSFWSGGEEGGLGASSRCPTLCLPPALRASSLCCPPVPGTPALGVGPIFATAARRVGAEPCPGPL